MKLFGQLLQVLLFCWTVFSPSHAVFPHSLSLHASVPAASSEPHQRTRRHPQALPSEQALTCQRVLQEGLCSSNGLAQAELDVFVGCGETIAATAIQHGCRRNSLGDHCGLSLFYFSNVTDIVSSCQTSLVGDCTSECRDRLTWIRGKLGCCITAVFNNSYARSDNSMNAFPAFEYGLWSNCGVEPVTDECASSSVVIRKDIPVSNCDLFRTIAESTELTCSKKYIAPIQNALTETGNCETFLQLISEKCAVSESGERCGNVQTFISNPLKLAQQYCDVDAPCSKWCAQALDNLASVGGCCVNTLFNSTAARSLSGVASALSGVVVPNYDFFDFAFWSSCGLEPLDTCKVKFL